MRPGSALTESIVDRRPTGGQATRAISDKAVNTVRRGIVCMCACNTGDENLPAVWIGMGGDGDPGGKD